MRSLVARARDRDADAFRELVVLHQDRAYALALRITRSPADAEEVAQDGFVRAWLALPRFRGESSFGTWLHRIVARRALDRLSAMKARGAREVDVEEAERLPAPGFPTHAFAWVPEHGPGAGDLESVLRARRVERLVFELPAAQRAAVTLYYYEGRSVAQVAEMLQMPENTVKTHLSRARSALRAALLRENG
ncbi:MAG TPA: RNA polymerase sigma factor [Terriglobales bacterium]|nr:RNA polymerase sigma factor [Terriglobales bacterium]